MIKRFFILLLAIVASVGMSWATENSIVINGTPQVGDNSISLTYYFDPANVPGITGYAPTLKVKCVTDNKWDEEWLSLSEIRSGTTTVTLNELGSFQEGKSYDVCFAYYNGSWVDDVFQSFTPAGGGSAPTTTDLASITGDYTVQDGEILTGTLGTNVKITIAAGATVTLNGVNINWDGSLAGGDFAGLNCVGNATIILADGSVNYVKGFMDGPSGIYIAPNYTITIQGNGTLHAATKGGGAAIGCGYSDKGGSRNGGNIVINGGTIYANGGNLGAGIGGGGRATIGNITINGGIIYAVGGGTGAGIGGGQSKDNSWKSICGNITISSNVKYLKATKGSGAAHSIGKGSSAYSVCGTVTIPGGATGYVSTSPYVYCNPDYVIELINAIPNPVVLTAECKAAIDEARAMYTALTDDQKTSVTNYSTLTDAEAAYAALLVEDKIAAIGTVECTAESKALIDAARTAYDALSDEAKALVTNYSTLTDAEAAYAALNQAEADKVIAKIALLPNPMTAADVKLSVYTKVQDARAAFDALTADQKLLVTNLAVLEAAEAAFAPYVGGGGAPLPDGALSGAFSINASGDKIVFSKGNLQYVGSWQFATNQWDAFATDQSDDHRDLFGWGTKNNPNNVSTENSDYTWAEWGENAISNGGDQANAGWRTLTNDEWTFLLNTRSAATRFAKAYLFGTTHGLILFPDNYSHPAGLAEIAGINSTASASWNGNQYSAADWTKMEAAGAVFLPLTGYRSGTSISEETEAGEYWTSTPSPSNTEFSYYLYFSDAYLSTYTYGNRVGNAVRLVISADAAGGSVIDDAKAAVDLINTIPTPVTLDSKDAIDAARAAVDALDPAALALIDDADMAKLTDAEAALTALNQAEADKVIAKIALLPNPVQESDLKLSVYDKVLDARAAYDALNAAQQALVTNYQTLLDAEAAFDAIGGGGGLLTVVVIYKSEFTSTGVTKEGVNLALSNGSMTADDMLAMDGSFEFSTSLGKFTNITIETDVNIMNISEGAYTSAGWPTGTNLGTSAAWTGNSESVLIDCMVAGNAITITCTVAPASVIADAIAARDLINAIPDPVTLDDACVKAIKDARAAVDALGENASLIDASDMTKLTDAEAALTALNQAEADKVVAKINNIPTPVELKLATRDSIESARAAYDALNAAQQALVSNYQTLLDAEEALAALNPGGGAPSTELQGDGSTENPYLIGGLEAWNAFADAVAAGVKPANAKLTNNIEGVTRMVGNNTNYYTGVFDGNGFTITMNIETNLDSAGLFRCVKEATFMNLNLEGTLNTSRKFAGSLVGAQLSINTLVIKNVCSSVAMTLSLDGDLTSGGIVGLRLGTIQITDCLFKGSMTSTGGGSMCGGIVGYSSSNLTLVRVIQAGTYNLNTSSYDGVFVRNNDANLNAQNCYYINGVGGQSTCAAATQITTDQLNTQTYVDLLQTGKEDTYWVLKDGVLVWNHHETSSPSPLDSAQAVKDLIDAIPTPVAYPTSGAAIEAALNAFNELSDAAKGALDDADVQKLNDAAPQYAALEAIAAIEAIPAEIVYDPLVKAAIETAREKYDALSDASKALVDDEVVAKLTNAEQAWADLVALIEHNVSYMGKDGELKNEKVALLHIPNPAPDFNGYEFVRWDVKAGDFLEEGLRIKAIYTPIITTNPAAYDSLMYNGTAQTLITAGVAKEGHIEYRINDGEWSAELPQATFAAAYVVYYKLVREGHEDYIADPINVTIAKAPVAYTAPTAVENLVYTASNQTLIAAGQTNDGTFEYSLNPTLLDSWKAELPQAKDAGTYSVYYRVQGDLNHLDSTAVDPIAVTIAKAELTATADDKNVIYGDAVPAYTVTYAGWQGDDDATVLTGDLAFACEYASTSNVGEYTITPSGVDAANYTITFVNGKVTVAKAESGCIAPVVYDTLVYNGVNQTLIIAGQPMGGEMQYSLDTTVLDCWSTSLPQAKDAGTYNVYYRVKGDMNHNDHYYDLITVSIAKAALTATADDKNVVYGDAVPEYTVSYSGWMGTDEASVLTGTIAFACEYAPTSNVGDYTITPSGVDAANYIITFVNGKVTVAKADLMITADDKNVIYGEVAPAFTASYSGWKNTDDASVVSGLAYTCEYAPTSNVGEYTITPHSATAQNYAISYTNGKVTVAQAALTITAEDKVMIYGDEHPEFTVTYSGWKNSDDESVVSGLQFSTPYAPGSYIGTYAINPNSATALNYAITFVDGTLTVNKAVVSISGAEAEVAKFADGHANAVVLQQGTLNGIKLNDPIGHVTTAVFSSADVAENLTITLFYELTGDAALLNNYNLDPTSDIFTTEGVIIEPFIPDNEEKPEDKEATVNEGIEIYAYGYCDGSGYSLKYHLESGNPDQYKIDFADSRFTDVDWTNLVITGKDGTIDIEIPVDLPTGDYTMTVYFRDSRFDWLESRQFNVTFHVNLPETYVRPLFENVIAIVDTCHCLTDIQWYWRANSTELWQPIEGANGYYYHVDGKLTGEYFVYAKMNGEPTYTCGQADMETLYGETQKASAPVVKAYPNPVVTTTTVTIENSTEWIHNIRIVNLMGAEVMNDTFEGDKTSVEMGNYPQGNYMISVDGIVVKVMKK